MRQANAFKIRLIKLLEILRQHSDEDNYSSYSGPSFLYFQGNFAGLCPVTHNVFIIKPHSQYYIKIQGENQAILNIRSVNFETKRVY